MEGATGVANGGIYMASHSMPLIYSVNSSPLPLIKYQPLTLRGYLVQLRFNYSRTSVMWTPKGRTKNVHNSEVSTLVKLGVATGHRLHKFISDFSSAPHVINGRPLRTYHVHVEKVSMGWGVHKRRVSTRQGSTVINQQQSFLFIHQSKSGQS